MTKAEIGLMQLQAKECQGLPANLRSWKRQDVSDPPLLVQRECVSVNTLILDF